VFFQDPGDEDDLLRGDLDLLLESLSDDENGDDSEDDLLDLRDVLFTADRPLTRSTSASKSLILASIRYLSWHGVTFPAAFTTSGSESELEELELLDDDDDVGTVSGV